MNESIIIPDDLQHELLRLRDQETTTQWDIGDITVAIETYNDENDTHASKMQIYKAVGSMVGKQSRTIREHAATSRFYDQETRLQFDVLSFDHFRVAIRHKDPIASLQWAMDRVSETGKPATVDEMVAAFHEEDQEELPNIDSLLPLPGKIREGIIDQGELIPAGIARQIHLITIDLEKLLQEASAAIEKSLKEKSRVQVKSFVVEEVSDALLNQEVG